jgi:lipopolysaccharide transport system permease protein
VKYRGSILGFLWSFLTPLVLLAIYTAVFGLVFRATWPGGQGGMGEFAVMIFCGLIPFNFYNETLSKASQVIVSSPNYVKRIAFPTEVLPLVMMLSAFVHAVINMLVLLLAAALLLGHLPWTVIFLPLIWLPIVISAAACALLVASVGVFLRDVGHLIGVAFSALLFASPILYPASQIPQRLHFLLFVNPIAFGAANFRKTLVMGQMPQWSSWVAFTCASFLFLVLAAGYFERIRRRFADVI